jgi:hypothetical protein
LAVVVPEVLIMVVVVVVEVLSPQPHNLFLLPLVQ